MIRIGYRDNEKHIIIDQYVKDNGINHTVLISPEEFMLSRDDDCITYKDAIEYPPFYRLLQEIDDSTLIVLNECLRTQNRYDLTYNCIRHYLNQTTHQIIFQQLPQIDSKNDFMILFDFDTRSRWKRSEFDINLILDHVDIKCKCPSVEISAVDVPTQDKTIARYKKERDNAFARLGMQDPHIIPRRLHLIGGIDKRDYALNSAMDDLPLFSKNSQRDRKVYIARNQRLKQDNILSYRDKSLNESTEIEALIDLPHRFIDFSDFMKHVWRFQFTFLRTELKVDHWYSQRYKEWSERVNETCASLRQ